MVYGKNPKYIPYYLFLLGLLINYAPKSYAEINLDKNIQSATIINGIKGGNCITGNCIVSGGDKNGAHIFHRFNSFDTRGSINSVLFKNENYKNVIVGVSSSKGSFINKPISLSEKGNLFWVSPGGINIGNGADFINTSQLHLSTANSLHFSNGVFDVFSNRKYHLNKMGSNPLIKKEGFQYTQSNPNKISNISLSGINVSIDENLYIDALDGNVAIKDTTIKTTQNNGGEITVSGKEIKIEGSSKLISQGEQSGGLIQIGGSWQNSNPYIRQAVYTEIGEDVLINASAKDNGNGGEIVIWSDIKNPSSSTVVSGTFKVDGGAQSGDGGKIETSGANLVIGENISVSMGSIFGSPGKWLLDPEDYVVTSTVATALVNALASGDVEISTTCSSDTYYGCSGSGDGDITIGSDLNYSSSSGTLTLTAASQVIVNSGIDTGSGGLVITAPDGLTGSGQIRINPNSINSTSGDISVNQSTNSTYSGAIAGSPIGSSDFKLYGTGTLSFASTPTNFTKVLQAEYGSLSLTEEWQTVTLTKTYNNAVVIISDPSNNDPDPVTTRIKNVTSNSFDIKIDEPEAHNGTHSTETASYFVGEAGNYEMSDGTKITLGTVSSNDLTSNAHESTFDIGSSLTNPAVFTQVQTSNDSNWVVTRVRSVTSSTFVLGLQEQESFYSDGHAEETVGYLAIEKGSNKSNGSHTIDVGETSNSYTHSIGSQSFGTTFSATPALIVKMATRDGADASNVRTTSISNSSFSAYIDEESSRDSEQSHTTEALYYLALLSPSNTSSGNLGFAPSPKSSRGASSGSSSSSSSSSSTTRVSAGNAAKSFLLGMEIKPPKLSAFSPQGPAPTSRGGGGGTSSLSVTPSSAGRGGSASSGGSSNKPSTIRVSAGGNIAPPKSIGGQGVRVSLALDSSQGMGDSSAPATPSSGPSSPSSSEGGSSSSGGGRKSKSSKSGSKNSTSNSKGDGDNSSSSDSGGDSSSSEGKDSNKNKSEPSGEETSSEETSSDESSSDESSSDESSSDESSSDEESSEEESSSSEKENKKDSKSSKVQGDRNKKDKESRNEIINQANRIAFAKVPNTEVLANLNKFMSRNRTNTIDVLNLDKSLNSGTNLSDIQRQLKIAKSKKRNATSLTRLFYKEKLFASNSQSLKSNESKIFFETNLYNPAVMHLRFTKAVGKTTTENTDSFLDVTLIPSEGEVIGKRVELSMKEFGKNLGLLYSQLSRQENLNVELESSPSRVLNNMIFESIKPDLERLKVTTLLISADRGLQAIPYAALHDGENYFGDSYAFSLTPSLGLTDISVSDSEDKKLLAIGASEFRELAPLPLVEQELSKIGGTKSKEIVFNKEFTPESFFEKAIQEKYDMIHIATHAEFKPGGPNASRLFSGTTPITLDNFSILRKGRIGNPLDLVVFSACRTALGDPETELGFSGLALQAGAKSAIGTLWYVDDVMTSAYFVQMYKFLDLGIPKAEAMQLTRRLFAQKLITLEDDKLIGFNNLPLLENLNLSQKRLIKNGLNNPFFWAGIELMGSPW